MANLDPETLEEVKFLLREAIIALEDSVPERAVWRLVEASGLLSPLGGIGVDEPTGRGWIVTQQGAA